MATKSKQADHIFLDANGEEADIAAAVGYAYQAVKPAAKAGEYENDGEPVRYMIPNATPGEESTMLALFGAKTKATNVASGIRNGPNTKATATTADELAAIRDFFAAIAPGNWPEADRASGPRYDLDLLAKCVVQFNAEKRQVKSKLADIRARLDDAEYRGKVTRHTGVMDYYRAAKGTAVSDSDLD